MSTGMTRRAALEMALGGAGLAAAPVWLHRARAEAGVVRIGVLTDLSGPNSAGTGKGAVTSTRMAAEDFMAAHPDVRVEVLVADYQSKPDIATAIARGWIDEQGVDVISNVNNSAAALAIANLVREKNKVALFTAPASSDLTGKACGPNHVQWTYDIWALGHSTGGALVASAATHGSLSPPTTHLAAR